MAGGICTRGGTAVSVVTDLAGDDLLVSLIARTNAELGPIDVLVNNAC